MDGKPSIKKWRELLRENVNLSEQLLEAKAMRKRLNTVIEQLDQRAFSLAEDEYTKYELESAIYSIKKSIG